MNAENEVRKLCYVAPEDLSAKAALLVTRAEEAGVLREVVDLAKTMGHITITIEDGSVVAKRG